MRVELCAWRDAVKEVQKHPNINYCELSQAIKISEYSAKEFLEICRALFNIEIKPKEPKIPKTREEINRDYYNRNKTKPQALSRRRQSGRWRQAKT